MVGMEDAQYATANHNDICLSNRVGHKVFRSGGNNGSMRLQIWGSYFKERELRFDHDTDGTLLEYIGEGFVDLAQRKRFGDHRSKGIMVAMFG